MAEVTEWSLMWGSMTHAVCASFVISKNLIDYCSLRSWRDCSCSRGWIYVRLNLCWRPRRSRAKTREESSWNPACHKTWVFWIVRPPVNGKFRLAERCKHVNQMLHDMLFCFSQGKITTTLLRACRLSKRVLRARAIEYLNIRREIKNREVLLKKEQETAVKELLCGKDVMAVLPMGFGKSLIYTIFAFAFSSFRPWKAL